MNVETQLKLQAYLDGELPDAERKAVETLLTQDAAAQALFAELGNTSRALHGFEADIKLPESREFYWSKIQREIGREPAPRVVEVHWTLRLQRWLVPAGGVAAVALVLMFAIPGLIGHGPAHTDSEEGGVFTYENYDTGTTLVWLDYPEENDFADMESDDTLEL